MRTRENAYGKTLQAHSAGFACVKRPGTLWAPPRRSTMSEQPGPTSNAARRSSPNAASDHCRDRPQLARSPRIVSGSCRNWRAKSSPPASCIQQQLALRPRVALNQCMDRLSSGVCRSFLTDDVKDGTELIQCSKPTQPRTSDIKGSSQNCSYTFEICASTRRLTPSCRTTSSSSMFQWALSCVDCALLQWPPVNSATILSYTLSSQVIVVQTVTRYHPRGLKKCCEGRA